MLQTQLPWGDPARFTDAERRRYRAIPKVVDDCQRLSINARRLYAVLLDHARKKGVCWPGQQVIAEELAVTVRTVRNITRELVAAGLVAVEQRGLRRTNLYTLAPDFEAFAAWSAGVQEPEKGASDRKRFPVLTGNGFPVLTGNGLPVPKEVTELEVTELEGRTPLPPGPPDKTPEQAQAVHLAKRFVFRSAGSLGKTERAIREFLTVLRIHGPGVLPRLAAAVDDPERDDRQAIWEFWDWLGLKPARSPPRTVQRGIVENLRIPILASDDP